MRGSRDAGFETSPKCPTGYRKTWLIRLLREQETAGSNPATPTVSSSTLDGSSRNHGVCGEVVNASDCDSDIRGFESRQTPEGEALLLRNPP